MYEVEIVPNLTETDIKVLMTMIKYDCLNYKLTIKNLTKLFQLEYHGERLIKKKKYLFLCEKCGEKRESNTIEVNVNSKCAPNDKKKPCKAKRNNWSDYGNSMFLDYKNFGSRNTYETNLEQRNIKRLHKSKLISLKKRKINVRYEILLLFFLRKIMIYDSNKKWDKFHAVGSVKNKFKNFLNNKEALSRFFWYPFFISNQTFNHKINSINELFSKIIELLSKYNLNQEQYRKLLSKNFDFDKSTINELSLLQAWIFAYKNNLDYEIIVSGWNTWGVNDENDEDVPVNILIPKNEIIEVRAYGKKQSKN